MPWFVYNISGVGPRQLFAPNRQRADEAIRDIYPNVASSYAGQSGGDDKLSGIQVLGDASTTGQTNPPRGDVPPDVQADLDDALKMSAFSSGMEGRGFDTEGPLGSLLRKQAVPTYANFSLDRSFAGNDSTPDANSFRAYTVSKGPNAYSDALGLYRKASSAPYGSPDFYDALNRAGVGDEENKQQMRANFMDVAQGAARARYSPAAARFLPDEETLNRRFNNLLYTQGGKGANAQGVSLLDFLKKQYGF